MLQTQTVEPRTLEILRNLMAMPELSDFYLVGGTALSLQFGHRISVPQALIYFDDAEDSEEPVSLEGQTWESIKLEIQTAVRNYLR